MITLIASMIVPTSGLTAPHVLGAFQPGGCSTFGRSIDSSGGTTENKLLLGGVTHSPNLISGDTTTVCNTFQTPFMQIVDLSEPGNVVTEHEKYFYPYIADTPDEYALDITSVKWPVPKINLDGTQGAQDLNRVVIVFKLGFCNQLACWSENILMLWQVSTSSPERVYAINTPSKNDYPMLDQLTMMAFMPSDSNNVLIEEYAAYWVSAERNPTFKCHFFHFGHEEHSWAEL
jgi:hypothetical protein